MTNPTDPLRTVQATDEQLRAAAAAQGGLVAAHDLKRVLAAAGIDKKIPPREQAGPDVGRDLTLEPSGLARLSWRAAWEESPELQREQAAAHVKLAEAIPFARETFAALFDGEDSEDLPTDQASGLGRRLRRAVEATPDWGKLVESASTHRSIAVDATRDLTKDVLKILGLDDVPEDDFARLDPRDVDEMASDADALAEELGTDQEARAALQAEYAAVKAKAEQLRGSFIEKRLRDAVRGGQLAGAVRAAAARAKEKAEAVATMSALGFSLGGAGDAKQSDVPEELVAMLIRSKALQKIFRRAGRILEAHSSGGQTRLGTGRCDVVGVVTSGDVARTTVAFKARLAHGPTRALAVADLSEGQAQSLEQRGEERMRRGPVIILEDRSGSMEGPNAELARGFAVALLVALYRARRAAIIVSFSGEGDQTAAVMRPSSVTSLARAVGVASLGAGGGTDVEDALRAAKRVAADHKDFVACADLSLITDGEFDALEPKEVEALMPRGGRAFIVGVNTPGIAKRHPEFIGGGFDLSTRAKDADNDAAAVAAMQSVLAPKKGTP